MRSTKVPLRHCSVASPPCTGSSAALVSTLSPSTHVFVCAYDFAIPDGRHVPFAGPWLKPGFDSRGYLPVNLAFRTAVVRIMLTRFESMVSSVAADYPFIHVVPTQGTLPPGTSSWHNELHPTEEGFKAITRMLITESGSDTALSGRSGLATACPADHTMLAWTFQMTTCRRAYAYCERSKRIARTSRASRRNSAASCSPSPGSWQSPSATISSGWRRPFDAPNGKPRRSMTARPSSRPGCAFSAAHRSSRRCGWNRRSRKISMTGRACAGTRLLRLQAALFQGASLLRFDVRAVWRLQLRQARAERGPEWPVRVDHRRAREDRLPGFAQTSARRGACHRHDTLSSRCRRPLFEGAGFRFVSRASADPWAGPAPHAERGTVHEISGRAAAAPRLHSQQRLPDGASAGGILSTPAGAGSGIDRRPSDRPAMRARRP